ncbi:hypothetical protein, unlikely [Trypanosoma brucei gambiense DAL972]|uniref:Uncharacterized protein n=1 Tax=Trypanosoma brucei gambiense (strain MHOM/CI/86/DAL972) TaxID=679716 RepID=C9ZZN8_TRYB9|nr:hypothetical protein, unlikely [Trypanosoma brucei gambiense DAL972]CBH14887.1 hypothetical protein, unlikely [Trypanosoma brucei gambiense DAL972]|eukprot:XP_011777153.1 hypothetical protein, unlikely [Trypanosoma brucei gambiense DAL972]
MNAVDLIYNGEMYTTPYFFCFFLNLNTVVRCGKLSVTYAPHICFTCLFLKLRFPFPPPFFLDTNALFIVVVLDIYIYIYIYCVSSFVCFFFILFFRVRYMILHYSAA